MGIYLNPDNKGFWQAIRSKIYVDKSNLIACTNELINTEENISVSAGQDVSENPWRLRCWQPITAAAVIRQICLKGLRSSRMRHFESI